MLLPLIGAVTYQRSNPANARFWRATIEACMRSVAIIEMFEVKQLRLQVGRCPEQGAIEALSSKGSYQAFHKRMG
jgi:hypothetical protein